MLTFAEALASGPLVLDGGLSTELENHGHDLSSSLWSARLLRDDPEAILGVHRDFLRAGADVLTTASYQASREAFGRAGLDPASARELVGRSIALARAAFTRERRTGWVAGSAGPYGAMLANGSEYTGDYGDVGERELRDFHRSQLGDLVAAGADVLACETIPSVGETRALIAELEDLGHPAWVSLTTVTGADGTVTTRQGEPAQEAFALAGAASSVVAVGINCTDPDGVEAAVRLAAQASGKPVVAYPNSGEGWDATARSWTGTPGHRFGAFPPGQIEAWMDGGARLVGGCCRVTPAQIGSLAVTLSAPAR